MPQAAAAAAAGGKRSAPDLVRAENDLDIERIGDQASDIAEIVTYLSGACGHNTHIDQMAQATIKMVTDSLTRLSAVT